MRLHLQLIAAILFTAACLNSAADFTRADEPDPVENIIRRM